MASDASYDIDIVRHHDVATSTANLLDASSESSSDSDSEEEPTIRIGKPKNVSYSKWIRNGCFLVLYFGPFKGQ